MDVALGELRLIEVKSIGGPTGQSCSPRTNVALPKTVATVVGFTHKLRHYTDLERRVDAARRPCEQVLQVVHYSLSVDAMRKLTPTEPGSSSRSENG